MIYCLISTMVIKPFESLPCCNKFLPSSVPLHLSMSRSCSLISSMTAKKKASGTIKMHGQDPLNKPKQDQNSTSLDQDNHCEFHTLSPVPLQCQPPLQLPLTSNISTTGGMCHHRGNIYSRSHEDLNDEGNVDPVLLLKGRLDKDDRVFRQEFSIRSFDIDFDKKASLESLMKFSQEAYINHMYTSDPTVCGFGATLEMNARELVWVYLTLQVAVDYYPSWDDIVHVETWFCESRKSGVRRDCIITDKKTNCTVMRVSCLCVMMNKQTRKLAKLIGPVKEEMEPHFRAAEPIFVRDGGRLPKVDKNIAGYIRKGLTPEWSDLDVNHHVNNVKFISWILEEGTPVSIRESHELSRITLEYRKECNRESIVESLSTVTSVSIHEYKLNHFLCLEDGTEIARASTSWRPKK